MNDDVCHLMCVPNNNLSLYSRLLRQHYLIRTIVPMKHIELNWLGEKADERERERERERCERVNLTIKSEWASCMMSFSERMCSCCLVSTMCLFFRIFMANVLVSSLFSCT